jgi:hypothetical protein
MGSSPLTLHARYVPRRLLPGLAASLAFAAIGVLTAVLAGQIMGWILAAFMLWSAGTALTKIQRRDPVLTVDDSGVHDHRVPATIGWDEVESMRTVDRRVVFVKVPLLELVPSDDHKRDRRPMLGAVVRGDIAFVDARDDGRLMVSLHHLDRTPEEILAAARAHRAAAAQPAGYGEAP